MAGPLKVRTAAAMAASISGFGELATTGRIHPIEMIVLSSPAILLISASTTPTTSLARVRTTLVLVGQGLGLVNLETHPGFLGSNNGLCGE